MIVLIPKTVTKQQKSINIGILDGILVSVVRFAHQGVLLIYCSQIEESCQCVISLSSRPCLYHLSFSLAYPCRSGSDWLSRLSVTQVGGASLSGFPDVVFVNREPLSETGSSQRLITVSDWPLIKMLANQTASVSASAGGV